MVKQEMIAYVRRMQALGRSLPPDGKKMYICGSPPAMLSRNYFSRKVPHVPASHVATLLLDTLIAHDKTEARIVLTEGQILYKGKAIPSFALRDSAQGYLLEVLRELQAGTPDWYSFCVEFIKWTAFVAGRSLAVEEWVCCTVAEKQAVLDFLLHLSGKDLPIDITRCPRCQGAHTGSFPVRGSSICAPCGTLAPRDLAQAGAFRLKKGFLQFVPVLLEKGEVLVNEAFYEENAAIIREASWENRFTVLPPNSGQYEPILDSFQKQFPAPVNFRMILSADRPDNWDILCDTFGRDACALVLLRHMQKAAGEYAAADALREEARITHGVKLEDLGEGRYAISKIAL